MTRKSTSGHLPDTSAPYDMSLAMLWVCSMSISIQTPDSIYDKAKLRKYLRKYKRFSNMRDATLESYIQRQWAGITVPEGQSSNYDKESVMHYE